MRALILSLTFLLAACGSNLLSSDHIEQSALEKSGQGCDDGRVGTIYSLPKAWVPVTLQLAKPKAVEKPKDDKEEGPAKATDWAFTMTVGDPVYYPDSDHTYLLCHNGSEFADNEIEIVTTPSGLLTSIGVKSHDRTGDVFRKSVEGVVELAKAGSGFGYLKADGNQSDLEKCQIPYNVTVLIDPRRPEEAQDRIDAALKARGVDRKGCVVVDYDSDLSSRPAEIKDALAFCKEAACYRRAAPVVFAISETSTNVSRLFLAELPNAGPLGRVDFQSGTFVLVEGQAEFDNGMLKRVKYVKPSEALAIASLPVDILRSIVSIPAALFETKAGALEAEAKLLEAEAELIAARNNTGPNSAAELTALRNEVDILKLMVERQRLLDPQSEN